MKLLIDADVRQLANGYMALIGGDNKYVHIAIAENALGRKLPKGAQVHHVDGDKTNNAPSNLVVCPDFAYHALLHARQRILDVGGVPGKEKVCSGCKRLLDVSAFVKNKRLYDGLHNSCRACVSTFKKSKGYNEGKFDWKASLSQQYRRVRDGYTKRAISWL